MRRFLGLLFSSIFGALIAFCLVRVLPARRVKYEGAPVAQAAKPVDQAKVPAEGNHVEAPYPTGYGIRGHRMTIVMSDGSVRTESDIGKTVADLDRGGVVVDGKKQWFKPKLSADREKRTVSPSKEVAGEAEPSSRPHSEVFGSWREDSDGVYRLIETPTLVR